MPRDYGFHASSLRQPLLALIGQGCLPVTVIGLDTFIMREDTSLSTAVGGILNLSISIQYKAVLIPGFTMVTRTVQNCVRLLRVRFRDMLVLGMNRTNMQLDTRNSVFRAVGALDSIVRVSHEAATFFFKHVLYLFISRSSAISTSLSPRRT